jgi:hypothetical protein
VFPALNPFFVRAAVATDTLFRTRCVTLGRGVAIWPDGSWPAITRAGWFGIIPGQRGEVRASLSGLLIQDADGDTRPDVDSGRTRIV